MALWRATPVLGGQQPFASTISAREGPFKITDYLTRPALKE